MINLSHRPLASVGRALYTISRYTISAYLPPFCKHGALVDSLPAVLTVGSLKWFVYAVRKASSNACHTVVILDEA